MASEASIGIKTLLYIFISTRFVAATISFLILFALPIPLFLQLKNGTFHQSASQIRRRVLDTPYSTYNLYLVYLALVDLAWLLPNIAAEFCTFTPNVCNPRLWSLMVTYAHPPPPSSIDGLPTEYIIGYSYGVANIGINAVIAYEVWLLLKATRSGQRITQPSLTRVNLQCGGVIFGSMVYGVFSYYMHLKSDVWQFDLSDTYTIVWCAVMLLLSFVPMSYAIGVTIFTKYRGYMPSVGDGSTPRERAVRGLALYFFRVVIVFVSIWVPSVLCVCVIPAFPEIESYLYLVVGLLTAFQPILTFWMILGKDDVKKYIKDFVTLTYLSGSYKCTCCRKEDNEADPEIANEQSRRKSATMTTTILGYNFEDANANDVADDANRDTVDSDNDNDDAEEQSAVMESNAFVGDYRSVGDIASIMDDVYDNEENENNGQVGGDSGGESGGNPKYKSRRIREGAAVRVLATGEACPVSLQPDDQAAKLESNV